VVHLYIYTEAVDSGSFEWHSVLHISEDSRSILSCYELSLVRSSMETLDWILVQLDWD
jgi:hypothetical protein